jgi:DNA-binding XRE family transcriptional regulator
MSNTDAKELRSQPVMGRQAALADIAERRRRDPSWDYRMDTTYIGPHPTFVQLMSDAEFERYMAEKVERGQLRANPYAPPATEHLEPTPRARARPPVRAALPFGQRIRELRRAVGWTQREVAWELGVSTRSIIRYEQGRSGPIQSGPLLALRQLESAHAQELSAHDTSR